MLNTCSLSILSKGRAVCANPTYVKLGHPRPAAARVFVLKLVLIKDYSLHFAGSPLQRCFRDKTQLTPTMMHARHLLLAAHREYDYQKVMEHRKRALLAALYGFKGLKVPIISMKTPTASVWLMLYVDRFLDKVPVEELQRSCLGYHATQVR